MLEDVHFFLGYKFYYLSIKEKKQFKIFLKKIN